MTNKFKELDLIGRVPKELWMEVRDTVQEAEIKTIPQEKEMQESKMVIWGGLEIAEKRREAKGKGEKERYTHLNAELQRIAQKDKKAFLSDQWKKKKKEENNRIGKTIDIFKKIQDTKGTFHVKMGTIRTEMVWT